jgi:hypothetical protein
METGREIFNQFLRGDPLSRAAFVPLLRGVTSRVEGRSREDLNADPTLWANALAKTADLLNLDGIVAGFDATVMAEACGCQIAWENDRPEIVAPIKELTESPESTGRMKSALEAAKRVFQVCRDRRGCVFSLTGPVTLAERIFGSEEGPQRVADTKQLLVKAVEASCQIRPDLLIFIEERPLGKAESVSQHRRIYNTLKNIASHYDIPAALYLQDYEPQNLARFLALRMDVYIPGPSPSAELPPLSEVWDLGSDTLGVGLSVPTDDFEKGKDFIGEALALHKKEEKHNFFFTSLGPVTRDVDLEIMRQLMDEVSRNRL